MAREKDVKVLLAKETENGWRFVVRFVFGGVGYVVECLDRVGVLQYLTLYTENCSKIIYAERWELCGGELSDGTISPKLYEKMEQALDVVYEAVGY